MAAEGICGLPWPELKSHTLGQASSHVIAYYASSGNDVLHPGSHDCVCFHCTPVQSDF